MSDPKVQIAIEASAEGVNRTVDQVEQKFEQMAGSVARSSDKASRAAEGIGDGAEKGAEKLKRSESRMIDSIKRATTSLELLGKTASQKLEFNIAAKGLDASKFEPYLAKLREVESAQNRLNVATGQMANGMSGAFQNNVRNAAFQLQDFTVQVNGGVDATKALGMQLPQLLGSFGMMGAVLGVAASLLPNIVQAFKNTEDSSKTLDKSMSDLNKAVGDVGSTVKTFDMDKLYEEFNKANGATRQAIIEQLNFQREFIRTSELVASKKFGESLSDFGAYGTLDKLAGSFASSGAEKLSKQLGVSLEVAKDMLPIINGLKAGTEDVNNAFNRFGTTLLSGNAKAIELASTMSELAKAERDSASASSAISEAQAKMAKGHVQTKEEANAAKKATSELAKEQKALADLLDSINGKSSDFDSAYVNNVETLLKAYDKGRLSLAGFNEVFARYVAMQPGAVAAEKERQKSLEEATKLRDKYMVSLEDETTKLVEKAKAAEYENSLIGATAEEISALTDARYQEKIELLQDKIAAIEMMEGRNAEVEAIEKQIDALRRLKSAEIAKPKLQAQAREWENFSRDIERSLTDALYRSFESGKDFGEAFADSLEATFKTMVLKFATQAIMTTGANLLNSGINAVVGNGSNTNYLGLANNASSIYNLGSAATGIYTALTTGAGALPLTTGYANAFGYIMGGDSLGAFIAANQQWASGASAAGAEAGAIAGSEAGAASASAASAASYAGYAAALYQAYKGDYASASLTAAGTYVGSFFGPWGAAIGALVGTLVGSFIQSGGGQKDNNRYSFKAGEYERLTGGSASVLQSYSGLAASEFNTLAALYGSDKRIGAREGWLSLDPKGTAQTQLNLELFDQLGNKLYSRMDEGGGNIENVGRSAQALQEAMADTMRDALLISFAKADLGDAVTVAFFDQFERGISNLSAERGDMLIGALKVGWLDEVLDRVDEATVGIEGVADAAANLFAIAPLKDTFDRLGASIFDFGAVAESTTPLISGLKKTVTNEDGTQRQETWRETYLRTMDEFIAVGNILEATGRKVSDAFKNGTADSILAASDALITLFGSVEDMQKSFDAYYQNFYSSSEKTARSWELIGRQFEALDLVMPRTREGFRDVVDSLDLNTEAGRNAFVSLMNVQSAFAALTPALDDAATSAQQAQAAIQAQKSAMLESQASQIAEYYDAIAAQKTQAKQAIIDSQINAAQSSISISNAVRDAFKQILDSLKNYRDSLISGNGAMSESARYAAARAAFMDTANKARLGDQEAAKSLQAVSDDFLSASRNVSTASGYSADYGLVLGTVDSVIGVAERQIPIAEQQLSIAEAQLASLQSIQASLVSVGAPSSSSLPVVVDNYQQAGKDWADWFSGTEIGSSQSWDIGKTTRLSDSMGLFVDNEGNAFTFSEDEGFYGLAKKSAAFAESLKRLYGTWSGPSFAVGADYLPNDMIAKVHEGERIIPAADNQRLINALSGESSTVAELRALRNEVAELRSEQRTGHSVIAANTANTAKTLNKFDYDGMPEVRAA